MARRLLLRLFFLCGLCAFVAGAYPTSISAQSFPCPPFSCDVGRIGADDHNCAICFSTPSVTTWKFIPNTLNTDYYSNAIAPLFHQTLVAVGFRDFPAVTSSNSFVTWSYCGDPPIIWVSSAANGFTGPVKYVMPTHEEENGIFSQFTIGDISFWFGVLMAIVVILGLKLGGFK